MHQRRTNCRSCGSQDLAKFLALGPTPLANSFLASMDEMATERSFPLDLHFCANCSLVQLVDVIDPDVLFGDYIYVSGTSDTVRDHFDRYAQEVVGRLQLNDQDLVVDVASNDGTLLSQFLRHDVQVVGIEPAANIAQLANDQGIATVNAFLGSATVEQLRESAGAAQAVMANNVLAHVDDPVSFLQCCSRMLHERGRLIVEVPYLRHLIERLEYDTVYHEHLSYFSVTALAELFARSGLSIERIDDVAIHGGSLRIWAANQQELAQHDCSIAQRCDEEASLGLTSEHRFIQFAADVRNHRVALIECLDKLPGRLAGYAAPAKGNTLLNYCGIGPDTLPYIVDKNPWKVGKYTPGSHIPIRAVDTIQNDPPDYLLILAWNFAQEVIHQQDDYRRAGGRFLIPIPQPTIVG